MIHWADPQLWYGFVGGWVAAGVVAMVVGGLLSLRKKAMRASE